MPLGTNNVTTTTAANFIPELWADEVIANYKANLVLANRVTKMDHNGRRGDVVHIPSFTRGTASAKAANTQVTLIAATDTTVDIAINKWFEYSKLIEDIVALQNLPSHRAIYTDDAGYALARKVDSDLWALMEGLQGGTVTTSGEPGYTAGVIGGDGITAYLKASNGNGTPLTDAGIRRVIQTLDDADVPFQDRTFVIPPVEKRNLMGIARFTEQAFVGEGGSMNTIRNGLVGDVYGIPVYASSQAPTIQSNDSVSYRVCAIFHRSALCHVEQLSVRVQTQYKQEYLGSLFTADTIYGVGELRNDAGVAIIVPATQ
jgi:hypothetical protein